MLKMKTYTYFDLFYLHNVETVRSDNLLLFIVKYIPRKTKIKKKIFKMAEDSVMKGILEKMNEMKSNSTSSNRDM